MWIYWGRRCGGSKDLRGMCRSSSGRRWDVKRRNRLSCSTEQLSRSPLYGARELNRLASGIESMMVVWWGNDERARSTRGVGLSLAHGPWILGQRQVSGTTRSNFHVDNGTTRSTLTVARRVEAEDHILSYLIPKSEPHDTIWTQYSKTKLVKLSGLERENLNLKWKIWTLARKLNSDKIFSKFTSQFRLWFSFRYSL